MKILKNKNLDNCMTEIFKHSDEFGIWSDDELEKFCNNSENINTIYALQSKGFINTEISNCLPEAIIITDYGKLYFDNKRSNRNDYILKSIVIPIIVSALSTLITLLITKLFN